MIATYISDYGAESLARALTVNKTLQGLNVTYNDISDIGTTHIYTAIQTNNSLKILPKSKTDERALSLATAIYKQDLMLHVLWCTRSRT